MKLSPRIVAILASIAVTTGIASATTYNVTLTPSDNLIITTATSTPMPVPTATVAPTPVPTATPTAAPVPTPTPTLAPTPTPTPTSTAPFFSRPLGSDGPPHMLSGVEFGAYNGPSAANYSSNEWSILGKYINYNDRWGTSSNGGSTVTAKAVAAGISLGEYSEPNRLCSEPFTNPDGSTNTNCGWANYVVTGWNESSFAHAANGSRVYTGDPSDGHNTYTAMDSNPAGVASDFSTHQGAGILADGASWTFMDNFGTRSGGGLYSNGPLHSSEVYLGGNPPYPGYSDANYYKGVTTFFNNVAIPGFGNDGSDPGFATAVAAAGPKALGIICEDCLSAGSGTQQRAKEISPFWQNEETSALTITNANKKMYYFVHGWSGVKTNDTWNYVLASELLTYRDGYTIFQTDGTDVNGTNILYFPGNELVATNPVISQSNLTNVSQLQDGGGAYYRQFDSCYIRGYAVNQCVSVVNNSTTATVKMPSSIVGQYSKQVIVNFTNSAGTGYMTGIPELGGQGTLTVTPVTVPTQLGPQQAAIYIK